MKHHTINVVNFLKFNAVNKYQNETVQGSNYGKNFYIGFMRNYLSYQTSSQLQVVVSAESNRPVQFSVETSSGIVYSGTTTASSPVTVNLPTSLVTNDATYTNRNKGVHVYTTGQGSISALAINYKSTSVGEYVAYPCQDIGGGPYEYYIVSTNSSLSQTKSEFLLVGCEDDTAVTITPSQSVSIPKDAQSSSSIFTSIASGVSKQIFLNKMQTLLIEKSSTDLTGSRIVSNKPLTVISGHECGNVITNAPCEHLSEQIPPSTTWGHKYLLVPFGERDNGQYYKIVSSQPNTTIVRTCNSTCSTATLSAAGSFYTFFTDSNTYCFVVSNKPTLATQIGIAKQYVIGGPVIFTLPSLLQYTNRYSFFSLKTTQLNFNIHQISVSVLAQYYQPNGIRLDGQPISCSWNAIYDKEGSVVGYGCHRSVTGGMTHVVSHDNPDGKLAVLVYGGSSSAGYGYLAGLHLTSSHSGT